jgi:hypothetical protein
MAGLQVLQFEGGCSFSPHQGFYDGALRFDRGRVLFRMSAYKETVRELAEQLVAAGVLRDANISIDKIRITKGVYRQTYPAGGFAISALCAPADLCSLSPLDPWGCNRAQAFRATRTRTSR